MCGDKYTRTLPCVAVFFLQAPPGGKQVLTKVSTDWWDPSTSSEKHPQCFLQHNTGKQRFCLGKVSELRGIQVTVFLSLPCWPVHSLPHAAAGIPKQNTLAWLRAAPGPVKQPRTVFRCSAGHTPQPTPPSKLQSVIS